MNWQEDTKLVDEMVELECINMLPLLRGMGFDVDPADIREDVLKHPHTIITVYDQNQLVGLVRYSNSEDDTIFVKSIQIRDSGRNKMALRHLFRKAAVALASERAQKIVSVVQRDNAASIQLHERFGFAVEKDHTKAIRYAIEVSKLQFHLQKFVGGQVNAAGS